MTYSEALKYIHSVSSLGSIPGLERIKELMTLLGNPQKSLSFVQVAGTNGKGSVSSMLSSVLTEAGYKTGLYTSPFIRFFNERIAIGGEMISDNDLAEITEYVKKFADSMDKRATEFELITAIGIEYFKRQKCDIVILEAGMGGRFDATNIVENTVLSIITGVSLDHTDYLGDTTEKIAWEKAGIIKPNSSVIFGGTDEAARRVIEAEAKKLGSRLIMTDRGSVVPIKSSLDGSVFHYKDRKDIKLSLCGSYQPYNAAVVLGAVDRLISLGFKISESSVRTGLMKTRWQARMECLSKEPLIIYDGGHNPEGIDFAVRSIKEICKGKKVLLLTGVMKDKNYRYIAEKLSEVAEKVFTVRPDNPRALPSDEYAAAFEDCGLRGAVACGSIKEGVAAIWEEAEKSGSPVFISGSLYMYSDIYNNIKEMQK